tara:strand:- start:800 stop:1663 length:864 start_codon:yes stop_codon:yes gene_type:complete
MARKLGTFQGTEPGLPERFADEPVMASRTATFGSFSDGSSYNVSRASTSGSTATWDEHHILIHGVRFLNVDDTNLRLLYFYQNDDTTNANARNATNLQFYLAASGTNTDRASNSIQVDFPIPLCIKNGCRITSNGSGPLVNINYTILNTTDVNDYDNTLKYKYLTGASLNSTTATAIHPNLGTIAGDVEIWGGVVYNHSTANDNYNSAFVTSTGESSATKARLSANEQKTDDDDASAAFTATYQPMFFPYPVICKAGAKIDCDDSSTYAAFFYRERKSKSTETIGWI